MHRIPRVTLPPCRYRHESLPRAVEALSGEKRHTRRLFVGQQHSVALTEHGELLVWGSNSNGQLGIPGVTRVHLPQVTAAHSTSSCSSPLTTKPQTPNIIIRLLPP